jgi:hypothetical protein
MRNSTTRFENLTPHGGLRCVWIPAQEGKATPVVARWVETKDEACERHENEDVCATEEERKSWPCMYLRSA